MWPKNWTYSDRMDASAIIVLLAIMVAMIAILALTVSISDEDSQEVLDAMNRTLFYKVDTK